jgi:hypothetical protein
MVVDIVVMIVYSVYYDDYITDDVYLRSKSKIVTTLLSVTLYQQHYFGMCCGRKSLI